jgi:hypothetical protein
MRQGTDNLRGCGMFGLGAVSDNAGGFRVEPHGHSVGAGEKARPAYIRHDVVFGEVLVQGVVFFIGVIGHGFLLKAKKITICFAAFHGMKDFDNVVIKLIIQNLKGKPGAGAMIPRGG